MIGWHGPFIPEEEGDTVPVHPRAILGGGQERIQGLRRRPTGQQAMKRTAASRRLRRQLHEQLGGRQRDRGCVFYHFHSARGHRHIPSQTRSSPAVRACRHRTDLTSASNPRGPPSGYASRTSLSERRSEEHTSELQSPCNLVCRLLLEKKKNNNNVSR